MEQKCAALDAALARQRTLISQTGEISELKKSLANGTDDLAQARKKSDDLLAEMRTLQDTAAGTVAELEAQRITNKELSAQLIEAGKMVESLKDAQAGLHERMRAREKELAQHAAVLKETSNVHGRYDAPRQHMEVLSPMPQQSSSSHQTMREHIQSQVRKTQNEIDTAVSNLETERSRYLSAADLNASRVRGSASKSTAARKVRIHRTGSVDIRFPQDEMKKELGRENLSSQNNMDRTPINSGRQAALTPGISREQMDELRQLQNQLQGKQTGLEELLGNIRNLVGSSERFLDRFFADKSAVTQGDDAMAEASAILQRDVMTLLDSNARLALQLQALGKDLQTVYRRFKTLESSISSLQSGTRSGRRSGSRRNPRNTPVSADVEPIIMQMQKWGRDLQSAAETLSSSRV